MNGSPVDVGWIGAYLLAGAAGIHPSVSRRRRRETSPNRRLAGFRAALSAAGMVSPAIVLGTSWSNHDYAMTVPAAALSALVLVRVVDLLRRNDRLRHLAEASEDRFRALVGDVDAIVWEADSATFAFQFVSRRAELLLGYPSSAWTEPEFWLTLVHPDDREWATSYRTSATAEGRDHELEYRMLAADGRTVWLRDSVRVVLGADGRPERLQGVMVDVTARRRAEAELERERSLLGATLEATGDGILVIDHDATITAFNSQFAQMWEVPEAVLATRSSEHVLNFLAGKVRDPDAYLTRVGELCTHPNAESSDLVELADGRFFLRYSKPQLLAGEIVGRVRSFRDVTEQVAAAQTVRESARRRAPRGRGGSPP